MVCSLDKAIPKIIHQIWLGGHTPPCHWMSTWMNEYITQHPEWRYMLWRQKDVDTLDLRNAEIYDLENHLANKADIARYEILYKFGGVFIDADSMWINTKPLDPLLEMAKSTGLFFGEEIRPRAMGPSATVTPILAVGVIGCARHHPAMAFAITTLGKIYRNLRFHQRVARWEATGPDFMTAALQHAPKTVFPNYFFFPGGWWDTDVTLTKKDAEKKYPMSYMYQFGYSTGKDLDTYVQESLSKEENIAVLDCVHRFG